jgi:hypothetical protein
MARSSRSPTTRTTSRSFLSSPTALAPVLGEVTPLEFEETEMTQPTTKGQDERRPPIPHLVDIRTVAEYLGVSIRYVRRLVANRDIPFIDESG